MSTKERGLVYVVTGGCGFLGQHLLHVLLEKEDAVTEIRLFDKHIDSSLNGHSTEQVKVVVTQGDITDYSSVLEVSKGADLVIHTASLFVVILCVPRLVGVVSHCPRSGHLSHSSALRLLETVTNIFLTGTVNVINACVENGIQYLVYTSSMEVVGPNVKGDPFIRGDEDTVYNVYHEMPYPRSKAKAEKLVLEANGNKVNGGACLYTCSLRPTGIYGEQHQLMRDFYEIGCNVAWMHLLAARSLRERPQRLGGEVYFCYDDSPYKSYEDFNMQFLSGFNFRQVRVPLLVLWVVACLNDLLRWVLKPVCSYTPLLNRYTLAVASTSFTVGSDKAQRHFQYRPLYDWDQCKARTQRWVDTFPFAGPKES
ncbi:unnamed protein product [Coregonus sp. 'balchen']|nr:unnamed protein product [Coregonus sp. 'balchen']